MSAPMWCPSCSAPRTWDRLDGSVAYYCKCPGYGAAATMPTDVSPVEASVRAAEAERAARPPTTAGYDAKVAGARARWRAAYGGRS